MKKVTCCLLFIATVLAILPGCSKEKEPTPVPIPPVFKEVVFPNANDVVPGREATIRGKGFSKEDKMFIEDETAMQEVDVLDVTNDYISFVVPREAGGLYTVTVERAGKQTTLDGELSVPLVVVIDDLTMPVANAEQGTSVQIGGQGFENGDEIQLTAAFYPEGTVYSVPVSVSETGISFDLPAGAYGVNNVIVVRGNRRSTLGTVGVAVNVGDAIGGGIVYYTDAAQLHGYIVAKENCGSPTEPFGPGVVLSGAAGTSKAIGTGKANTTKLLAKINSFRQNNNSWDNKKTAAEMCDALSVTVGSGTYTDWFLPSQEELIELFRVKDMLWDRGAGLPANNYWSSSEGDGDAAGWSAFYVNFYEPVNVVSANSDKEGWQIGIRAIRSF